MFDLDDDSRLAAAEDRVEHAQLVATLVGHRRGPQPDDQVRLLGVLVVQAHLRRVLRPLGIGGRALGRGRDGAEVVKVDFDPTVLPPRVLLDCFLAMHDPAKVRAHGKHAKGMGQYRSLIIATSLELQSTAQKALEDCQSQLGKELSTELILQISNNRVSAHTVAEQNSDDFDWFHEAEERHQRHDEKRKLASTTTSSDQKEQNLTSDEFSSLDPVAWLEKFGTRKKAVLGSLYQS